MKIRLVLPVVWLVTVLSFATASHVTAATPTPTKCLECKTVVKAAATFAENATKVADVIKVLQDDCDKVVNGTLDTVCKALAEGIVDLLPWIDKELSSLAWDNAALCAALGQCSVPCCLHPSLPEQIHLSLTSDPSEMAVSWTTSKTTAEHVVEYGLSPDALTSSAKGSNTTYTWAGWRGQLHHATMTGLVAGTQYFYRVGDTVGGWSDVISFRTLKSDAGLGIPLRVAQVGDMGYGPASDVTVASLTHLVEAGELDLLIHAGDISYADGDMTHWDVFLRKVEPIASRVPYMVAPGNHEFWFNFSAYKHRFWMPNAEATSNMFHSFNAGGLHVVSVDTESIVDTAYMSKFQRDWLRSDLELANERRAQQPWILSMGHRPLYCSSHNKQDCQTFAQVLILESEDLFHAGKVDVVVQAHVHNYERSFPVYQGEPTATNYSSPQAPVYVVNGAGGNREGGGLPAGDKPWCPQPSAGSMPQSQATGYSVITVTAKALQWQFFAANQTLLDDWTITK